MFNNNNLTLNRIQKLQRKAAVKQADREHDNNNDKALYYAYVNGNEEAGYQLLESYIDIISYIYRNPHRAQFKKGSKVNIDWTYQDKEDLMQEICLHFFSLIEEYDGKRDFQGLIKGKLHLRVYDNFFEDIADSKINEVGETTEDEYEHLLSTPEELGIFIDDEPTQALPNSHLELYQALNKLSLEQRMIVELSVINEWNSAKIASELGLKATTVRSHLKRGLDKLKQIMITEEEAV